MNTEENQKTEKILKINILFAIVYDFFVQPISFGNNLMLQTRLPKKDPTFRFGYNRTWVFYYTHGMKFDKAH